jgi:hypothetical protein
MNRGKGEPLPLVSLLEFIEIIDTSSRRILTTNDDLAQLDRSK